MIDSLYSALKRRRCGRAVTSESGRSRWPADSGAPVALPASPLRSEAANAAEEVLVLLVLIKVRFLSPPYSNCPGSTCLTHVGTEGNEPTQGFESWPFDLAFEECLDVGVRRPIRDRVEVALCSDAVRD